MRANEFAKFLDVALKMQKDRYSGDTDITNGVYFNKWGDCVFVAATNGREMFFEKLTESNLENLPEGRLDAAMREDLFPCKITARDITGQVLPLLKAYKSKNSGFDLLDIITDPAASARGIIKAKIYGRDFDLPVLPVSYDPEWGFMLLWRQFIIRDETFPKTAKLSPAGKPLANLSLAALSLICSWFSGHDTKPEGMVIKIWDTEGGILPHHAALWPSDSGSLAEAPYGAVTMQRVYNISDYD